ncbi:MAG TPA: hypothetical protein VJW51_12285, partial [Candidatus Acidoferrales bacterium]|nr:hypothetical protein [Candidatus Acidoferrales bacterium]
QQAPPAVPEFAQSAARAAFGADGEVVAYGDFTAAGGQQVVAVHRLSGTTQPGSATPGSTGPGSASNSPSCPPQFAETIVDVIRVSILVRDGKNWKEAFRADEHLKNRRGYMGGAPAARVSAWRMGCQKTPDSGFRLQFTPLDLPPGSKPVTVRVAWNPKRQEYDALDASGKRFLEPEPTPGNVHVRVEK